MSLQYNNTSSPYNGIIQQIEKEIGANRGDISGNTEQLALWTSEVNLVLDEFTAMAIQCSGRWQWDDSNQTGYPIIKGNIVSGQQDYPFTEDGSGNLILDVYKVAILPSSTATVYQEIFPTDPQSEYETDLLREVGVTGTPRYYDKTANGLFLDPEPNYSVNNGIKIYINREPSYFTTSHTDRKAGIPGIFHEYLAIKPALKYAGRKSLSNYNDLLRRVTAYEGDETRGISGKIQDYFNRREKDEVSVVRGEPIIYE